MTELVCAPRLFCVDSGLDGLGAVAIRGDRIVASGPGVEGPAHTVLNFPDGLLLPGLVELHAIRPAAVLGLKGEVGTLAVLRWNEEALPLRDVSGGSDPAAAKWLIGIPN